MPFNHSDKYSLDRTSSAADYYRPGATLFRLYLFTSRSRRPTTVISRPICICVLYIGLMTRDEAFTRSENSRSLFS